MSPLPCDLDIVRSWHLDGIGGLLEGDVDVVELGEVGVGVDETGRFSRFQKPDLKKWEICYRLPEFMVHVSTNLICFCQHRFFLLEVVVLDREQDVLGDRVVSDDPAGHLAVVPVDVDDLTGNQLDVGHRSVKT